MFQGKHVTGQDGLQPLAHTGTEGLLLTGLGQHSDSAMLFPPVAVRHSSQSQPWSEIKSVVFHAWRTKVLDLQAKFPCSNSSETQLAY